MSEQVDTFLAITGSSDATVAENFLEMAGHDLETAISLFFEHGPSAGANANSHNDTSAADIPPDTDSDAAFAERLQQEAYSQQDNNTPQYDTRPPDEAVHERLVGDDVPVHLFPGHYAGVGGSYGPLLGNRSRDIGAEIYGSSRVGIFNQRDDVDVHMDYSDDDDEGEEDRIEEVDSDDEPIQREETAEERLARLFRPPFDLIEKLDLNTAKIKARQQKKWILVNIQNTTEFQCHALNRDFWSSTSVKEVVREHFIFLQYHHDSRSGQEYSQFYNFDEYPHIAILDPITGERLKVWSKVPDIVEWLEEVDEFLEQFSLDKGTINPTVEHKRKIDPTTLSEEQQLEYAISQSLNGNSSTDADDVESAVPKEEVEEVKKPETEEDIVKAIEPIAHPEPTSGDITRVQIRTGDGKRVVHKFNVDDKVLVIYQFVKASFPQLQENDVVFTLTSQRDNLFSKIDETIGDAGLKNASVLVEVQDS